MRFGKLITLGLIAFCGVAAAQKNRLPLGGNAYADGHHNAPITTNGIASWSNPDAISTFYFRVAKPGTVSFSMDELTGLRGKCTLAFTINHKPIRVNLDETVKAVATVGTWELKDTGYVAVTVKGITTTSGHFPGIVAVTLSGTAIDEQTAYVKNNDGNFFYWGRRGPSVHLNYVVPPELKAEWFYNEITVPKGNDVIGSYFMANGFGEGYFGIQVNSEKERRVLFSVWSPFTTDDPKQIPLSQQIILARKGDAVHAGEFGNEGAGGQSYLKYNWKTENTYRFLLHATPMSNNYTLFTAYFFAPESGKWQLIASFKRPQTQTYLKRLHSFLENFIPENGDQTRMVLFKNQWVCDPSGNWTALRKAQFTTDQTGSVGYRKDYAGGVSNGAFFLKNCGFFNNFTVPKQLFFSDSANLKPEIDFSKLP
jgi:hypothetical protein